MTANLSDRPIISSEADLLGRSRFAQGLAELISEAPLGSSLRIGVFGGWGEGKTSILQLVQEILQKAGHICVWIVPWVTETREGIADQITRQVAQALSIDLTTLEYAEVDKNVLTRVRSLANLNAYSRVADAVFGESLERIMGERVERAAEALSQKIADHRKDKKLIVFIDDVDRVKPELVPNLLLTVREALDQPDFFYIMALSPEVVERGLKTVHEAWGNAGEFLEKIIEVPRYVPEPTEEEIEIYTSALISTADPRVDLNALKQLSPLLPRNPRRLKLSIRYLTTLAPLIERFSESELDRRGFYLTQLLQLEFPDQVRQLLKDEKTLLDLRSGGLMDAATPVRRNTTEKEEEQHRNRPAQNHIDSEDPRRDRFLTLCEAVRQRGIASWGRYQLKEVFVLPEMPPVFTYQEVINAVEQWVSEPQEERGTYLIDALSVGITLDRQRCRAFWHLLMEIRDSHLESGSKVALEEHVRQELKIASEINNLIRFLGIERGLFREGVLSAEEWQALYKFVAKWAHFRNPDYYKEHRAEERILLEQIFEELPCEDRASLHSNFHSSTRRRDPDRGPEFAEMRSRISQKTAQAVVGLALQRFSEAEGAEGFWTAEHSDPASLILFDPKSALYTVQENLEKFRKLAENAHKESVVQLNFLTFFRQLSYGATQGHFRSIEDCRKILSSSEVLKFIWQAAVTRPLNPRIAGSLREDRDAVLNGIASESDMPLPEWWKRLEESFFAQKNGDG